MPHTVAAAAPDDSSAEPRAGGLRADTLAQSMVLLLGLTVVQRLIGLGRGVVFCRWLDVDQLGRWDLAYGFLMLAAPVAVLGLPGSFGRYVEYYRQQGQLRAFLRRTSLVTLGLAVGSMTGAALAARPLAEWVFGSSTHSGLMLATLGCLAVVIAQNYLVSLFAALRLYRVVSFLHFANTIIFTIVGVGFLASGRLSATSVVLAFAGACLLTSLAAAGVVARAWSEITDDGPTLAERTLWSKLLPFALWLWAANCLTNLFEVSTRLLIIHTSGLAPDAALELVGQLHSARVVPVLFVGVAELLAGMLTPHLSHDWERGRPDEVSRRLNLILKSFSFATCLGSVAVMFAAPLLFGWAFQGKYDDGRAVLPGTLACCAWSGLAIVATNYLWCAERARWASAALLGGLVVNVLSGFWLLPWYGLSGAVAATGAAQLTVLTLTLTLCRRHGMRIDLGVCLLAGLPALVALGPWVGLAALVSCAGLAAASERILTTDDRRRLAETWRAGVARLSVKRAANPRRAVAGRPPMHTA
jgi:polysaccharide transporter, PST family